MFPREPGDPGVDPDAWVCGFWTGRRPFIGYIMVFFVLGLVGTVMGGVLGVSVPLEYALYPSLVWWTTIRCGVFLVLCALLVTSYVRCVFTEPGIVRASEAERLEELCENTSLSTPSNSSVVLDEEGDDGEETDRCVEEGTSSIPIVENHHSLHDRELASDMEGLSSSSVHLYASSSVSNGSALIGSDGEDMFRNGDVEIGRVDGDRELKRSLITNDSDVEAAQRIEDVSEAGVETCRVRDCQHVPLILAQLDMPSFSGSDLSLEQHSVLRKASTPTFCGKCQHLRPARAHHCSICGRCIKKMDHHCPWVNNCVGHRNAKFFFLFLFYTCVGSLFVTATSIHLAFTSEAKQFGFAGIHVFLIVSFFIATMFGVVLLCFGSFHFYLITSNGTTLDSGGNSHFEYSFGSWKANVSSVLGTNPWLWFLPVSPDLGDGILWPAVVKPRHPQRRLQGSALARRSPTPGSITAAWKEEILRPPSDPVFSHPHSRSLSREARRR